MLRNILKINYLLFLLSIFYSCANSQPIVENKDTLVDIKTEKKEKDTSGQGVCIYPTARRHWTYGYFNPDTVSLIDTPLINYNQIIWYDTVKHDIKLSFSFADFDKSVLSKNWNNRDFVLTLDKKRLYGGRLTLPHSSRPSRWIVLELLVLENDRNKIAIRAGRPENRFEGTDPRNNRALFDRLKADGKIKQN